MRCGGNSLRSQTQKIVRCGGNSLRSHTHKKQHTKHTTQIDDTAHHTPQTQKQRGAGVKVG